MDFKSQIQNFWVINFVFKRKPILKQNEVAVTEVEKTEETTCYV